MIVRSCRSRRHRVEVPEDSGCKLVEVNTELGSNQWLSIFGAERRMDEIFRTGLR